MTTEDRWERRCVISGIGISEIGRRTGVPGLALTEAASRAAIADAGLTPRDIDGVTTVGETPLSRGVGRARARAGLDRRRWDRGRRVDGRRPQRVPRRSASGAARHVLVYRSVAMLGGALTADQASRDDARVSSGDSEMASTMGDFGELLAFHAYSAANWIGMHARRHMHLYGTTREQMGWVAVNARRHAALQPAAGVPRAADPR